jgi:hypothetical protein
MHEDAMIMGTHVLLGVTVLEKLDLVVDTLRQRLVPPKELPREGRLSGGG